SGTAPRRSLSQVVREHPEGAEVHPAARRPAQHAGVLVLQPGRDRGRGHRSRREQSRRSDTHRRTHKGEDMKFFLDTANIKEISDANAWGVLDVVNTNPTLLS